MTSLPQLIARRWFLRDCSVGLGAIALNGLLGEQAAAAPHFAPKAKRVIYLFMGGAPSHLELFDHKPQLAKFNGTLPPPELLKNYRAAFINPNSKLLGPKFKFKKVGKNGTELGELLPHLAEIVDDIAIVKSMVTDAFNHAPAQIFALTGSQQFGRPSIGAWITYGLGSRIEGSARLRRLLLRQQGAERRQLVLGLRLPAVVVMPARCSVPPAIPSSSSPTRPASTPPCNKIPSTPSRP